jgi:hypothetical protein
MDSRRRIRRIDEGDFLPVLVLQNATLVLWPAKAKEEVTIFDLVPSYHVQSKAEDSTLTGKILALR